MRHAENHWVTSDELAHDLEVSPAVRHLLTRVRQTGLPEPVTEYRFIALRRWRFDLAWPDRRIAVEVDGGTWIGGRHVSGAGYDADCHKINAATEAGWRVFRYSTGMVLADEAIIQIERVLTAEHSSEVRA
jgi:very-short-patch-repair endonuclease